jgi:hypothetical protein
LEVPGTGSICSYQCDNEGNYNITIQVGGFFSFNPSEKYEFVSWDDEIPN